MSAAQSIYAHRYGSLPGRRTVARSDLFGQDYDQKVIDPAFDAAEFFLSIRTMSGSTLDTKASRMGHQVIFVPASISLADADLMARDTIWRLNELGHYMTSVTARTSKRRTGGSEVVFDAIPYPSPKIAMDLFELMAPVPR